MRIAGLPTIHHCVNLQASKNESQKTSRVQRLRLKQAALSWGTLGSTLTLCDYSSVYCDDEDGLTKVVQSMGSPMIAGLDMIYHPRVDICRSSDRKSVV